MRHLVEYLVLFSGALGFTSLGFAIAWIRARERATRAEAYLDAIRTTQTPHQNLSPAVDAIAMEVERIGEGQRFLTRVLSEQQKRNLAQPRPPESITPH